MARILSPELLWHRLVATAPIQSLAWENKKSNRWGPKKKKKKKKKVIQVVNSKSGFQTGVSLTRDIFRRKNRWEVRFTESININLWSTFVTGSILCWGWRY